MTLAERLRAAMDMPAAPAPYGGDDVTIDPAVTPTAAAVLVAITDRPVPGVLLTVRHGGLRNHAGQVAFPGGRVDPGDAGVEAAALREAQEEIALDPRAVTLVGCDTPYRTVTGFRVTPVVGVVPADLPLVPAEAEVEALFEVPLAYAMDPANMIEREAEWQGRMRVYREMMWDDRRIWGATAAMLANLRRRIGWID